MSDLEDHRQAVLRAAEAYRDMPTSRAFACLLDAVDRYRAARAEELKEVGRGDAPEV